MTRAGEPFEFRATLCGLSGGLEVLHDSVEKLRTFTGRRSNDRTLTLFETALGEVGANVLTHGSPPESERQVEYALRVMGDSAVATFIDSGPPAEEQLRKPMPGPLSEGGRGLALARLLVDELGYQRAAGFNRWRLVKRL